MKIDWNAIKNNKVVKWAFIIGAPTVLVLGYYGVQYLRKRKREDAGGYKESKKDSHGRPIAVEVDETGMSKYVIKIPISDKDKFFTNGEFFNAIKRINYAFVKMDMAATIDIHIKLLPKDLPKLKEIVDKLNSNITISEE